MLEVWGCTPLQESAMNGKETTNMGEMTIVVSDIPVKRIKTPKTIISMTAQRVLPGQGLHARVEDKILEAVPAGDARFQVVDRGAD